MRVQILVVVLAAHGPLCHAATVHVKDRGTSVPTDFATGHVEFTGGPGLAGWGLFQDPMLQTFTLDAPHRLTAVSFCYYVFTEQALGGTINVKIDAGHDQQYEVDENVVVVPTDFNVDLGKGQNWIEWDYSEHNILLPAGLSSFSFEVVDQNATGVTLLNVLYDLRGNGYPGGRLFGVGGGVDNDLRFAVSATPVDAGLNADFDSDGDVDGNDFLSWQRGISMGNAARVHGDANGDGSVDTADLEVWKEQVGSIGGATSVPEPSAGALAALPLILLRAAFRPTRGRKLPARAG